MHIKCTDMVSPMKVEPKPGCPASMLLAELMICVSGDGGYFLRAAAGLLGIY